MPTIVELSKQYSSSRELLSSAQEAFRKLTDEFEQREDVKAIVKQIDDAVEQSEQHKQQLIDEMNRQQLDTTETEVARVTISKKVVPVYEDDDLIAAIKKSPKLKKEYGQYVESVEKIVNKREFNKTLIEAMELEEPKQLVEAGVKLERKDQLTFTPRNK